MRKGLVVIALLVATAVTPGAFAPRLAPADPITGKWTGALMPDDADARDVAFVLSYDGQKVGGSFTGLQTPGAVRKGTFDSKTGALHLELSPEDETEVRLTLDGKVADGVVSGSMSGEKVGRFRLERQK